MITRTRLALGEPHPRMGALISSYQDGSATPEEADRVERHLLACERCRAFYGGLQEARGLIGDLPAGAPARDQLAATYAAVVQRIRSRGRGRPGRQPGRKG